MRRVRQAVPLLFLLLAMPVLIACNPTAQPSTPNSPTTSPTRSAPQVSSSTPTPTSPATPSPTALPTDDEFATVISTLTLGSGEAEAELDALWRWILDAEMDGELASYEPPADVVAYRTWQVPDTHCAAAVQASFWHENAAYCPTDESIYFDEDWLRAYSADVGNIGPAAILAHEWGHHIQALAGTTIGGARQYPELEADCMAGIFLGEREKVIDGTYVLAEADLAVAMKTFFDLGDEKYEDSQWLDPQYHGSRLQRIMAFGTGYLGTLGEGAPFGRVSTYFPWCHGYRDYAPDAIDEIGPYRLVRPPGRTGELGNDTYRLPALEALGKRSASIELAWLAGATDAQAVVAAGAAVFGDMEVLIPPAALAPMASPVGDIVYLYFDQPGANPRRSGFYGLFPSTTEGTLAVMVYRDEPPVASESDPRAVALSEGLIAMAEISGRLCAPGQSATVQDPAAFNAACSDEQ